MERFEQSKWLAKVITYDGDRYSESDVTKSIASILTDSLMKYVTISHERDALNQATIHIGSLPMLMDTERFEYISNIQHLEYMLSLKEINESN